MGFGFNLFFALILVPLSVILFIIWVVSESNLAGKILGFIWTGVFGLVVFVWITNWIFSKKVLDKEDYYGEYTINRNYFKGEQADWQYNHFRFVITENDSIHFYVTEQDEIVESYHGVISTVRRNKSHRLVTTMEQPSHHVLFTNPTTYRSAWSFNLVFYSPKFNNMYFTKGKWKPIKD